MSNEQTINIAFAINDSYADHLLVALFSLLKNNQKHQFKIYVLSIDISKANKDRVSRVCEHFNNAMLEFIKLDKNRFRLLKLNIDYISIETYFRYIIPEVLPNEKRMLYLDSDLIVVGDIYDLYSTDIKNYCIAGVEDLYIIDEKYKAEINFAENDLYVNAGVLLMDLDKIRENKIVQKLFDNTIKLINKIRFQDQDIINMTFKGKIKKLDSKYNFASHNVLSQPQGIGQAIIFHYTGGYKPWDTINNDEQSHAIYHKYEAEYATQFGDYDLTIRYQNLIGHKDAEIAQKTAYIASLEAELAILCSPGIKFAVRKLAKAIKRRAKRGLKT
jgi:lipopolysaccharide biosynthesis glycosyltransferase